MLFAIGEQLTSIFERFTPLRLLHIYMITDIFHNHLRTARTALGLSQRQLAAVVGLKSPARICALEAGKVMPTLHECVVLKVLFKRSGEELWPRLHLEIEASADFRIRQLISRLERRRIRTARERAKAKVVAQRLAVIVDGLPEDLSNVI